jgi:hypothetical protein
MPPPVARLHPLDATLPDLGGEDRTKAMPPEPHRLVADLDAALMQKILDVPKREREPDELHHRHADDFRRRLEVLEGVEFGHLKTLLRPRHGVSQVPLTRPYQDIGGRRLLFQCRPVGRHRL